MEVSRLVGTRILKDLRSQQGRSESTWQEAGSPLRCQTVDTKLTSSTDFVKNCWIHLAKEGKMCFSKIIGWFEGSRAWRQEGQPMGFFLGSWQVQRKTS